MGEWISVAATDGSGEFKAYVAEPQNANGGTVIAIQEIFGVNDGMRSICDDLSMQGYRAICPDLFWRQEPDVELTDKEKAHWDKAFALFNGFDVSKGIEDIAATLLKARTLDGSNGKVGAVGYCLGGLLAYLAACETDVDASVGYYGVGIAGQMEKAEGIQKPLLLHIAGEDEFVPKDDQLKMHQGLDRHPLVTLYDYPGRDHAFARPDGIHHHAKDAAVANQRTADFFSENLK